MTKEDDKNFERCKNCWIYNNTFAEGDIKVSDHYHATEK